jgi:hypothetical protein
MLANCHVGKLSCWRIVMLANCKLVNCNVSELSCWRIVMLASCKLANCMGILFSSNDSATLQSMQKIINAVYNQRSLQSTPLLTA